jgi:hypothetical protein
MQGTRLISQFEIPDSVCSHVCLASAKELAGKVWVREFVLDLLFFGQSGFSFSFSAIHQNYGKAGF